ncbi:MAG: hypothetical protein FWC61_01530 [Proteobacteria bacterium]|nr:hypothetical protein [Pseudomonadota bacterium]
MTDDEVFLCDNAMYAPVPDAGLPPPFTPGDDSESPPLPSSEELELMFFTDAEDYDDGMDAELLALLGEEIDCEDYDNHINGVPPISYKNLCQACGESAPVSKEFIYNGKNILAGIDLDPWFVKESADKSTGEVIQEIKSYYKFDEKRLFFKSQNQKYFLKKSENFEIRHPYIFFYNQTYGAKIKTHGGWYYEIADNTNTIWIASIKSCNEAFIDIITYPDDRDKNYAKYLLLRGTVFKMLKESLSKGEKRKLDDIKIPHKAISCIFKSNYNFIKKKLDFPPRYILTPKGHISKKKPEATASTEDTFGAIDKFTKRINFGNDPDMYFYDCNGCASESVCAYKEQMAKLQSDLEKQVENEKLQEYLKKHHGQLPLFKFMLDRPKLNQ